jgi:hypothetical protein
VYINNKIITRNSTTRCRIGLCEDVEPQGLQVLVIKLSRLILI